MAKPRKRTPEEQAEFDRRDEEFRRMIMERRARDEQARVEREAREPQHGT